VVLYKVTIYINSMGKLPISKKVAIYISLPIVVLLLGITLQGEVRATSSTNYTIEPDNAGNSGGEDSSSAGYEIENQQVGDLAIGESDSANFNILHGYLYGDAGDVLIDFTVIPEKRLPAVGNNSTLAIIEIRNVGETTALQTYAAVATNNDGEYSNLLLTGIPPGTYDVVVKGYAHLKKMLSAQSLVEGANVLDFTLAGADPLLCGDVYTSGTIPDGDNQVNSLDATYLVSHWGENDAGVSDERADVDENHQVNSLDMTKLINNYGTDGD